MTTHTAEHAKLSPSSSKTWFVCPGSIALQASIPNNPSTHSDDGTAMHWVAAECLRVGLDAFSYVGEKIPVNGKNEVERTVEFTADMADLVQGYVDTVRKLAEGKTLLVEQRVEFSEFVGVPDQFGTADTILLGGDELMLIDLKTGHTPVLVDGNSQLMIYALGALKKLMDEEGLTDSDQPFDPFSYAGNVVGVKTIRLAIYQPKVAGMTEWTCTLDYLKEFAQKVRDKAQTAIGAEIAHKAIMDDMDRESDSTGASPALMSRIDEWCRIYLNPEPNDQDCAFCRAMPTCPSVRAKIERTVGAEFKVIDELKSLPHPDLTEENPVEGGPLYTEDVLAQCMRIAPLVEDFFKSVRAEVERRLLAGQEVPGFGLELGRKGPRQWKDEAAVIDLMRKRFRVNIEDTFNLKLKTPTAVEKMADPQKVKGEDGTVKVLEPVIGKRQWKQLLEFVTQSDPKPSVKPASVIKTPYVPPKPDAGDFNAVEDDQLW